MSNDTPSVILLSRDTMAFMVPSGARMLLHAGTEVKVVQSLGHSFTVNVYGNLARIDSKDADAIGQTVTDPLIDLPDDLTPEEQVKAVLKTVYDPEIPVNIDDLGLIYDCELTPAPEGLYSVRVTMTLTAPGCGMGPVIVDDVKTRVASLPAVEEVVVNLVFDPPWDRSMMSDAAKLALDMF
jgi:probable FeS assembly SUF system protein SufT